MSWLVIGWVLAYRALAADGLGPASFTVATYNLENYLDAPVGSRAAKSEVARAKVREAVLAMRPDVLALQEMGTTNALLELRGRLGEAGLDYPYWEHVAGWDTNIFVAVLSRWPIVGRRSHTNENFLLGGRRFRVSRGFVEVDVRVGTAYTLTVLAAHLKSRRAVATADEGELREQEAILLREKVDAILQRQPGANLVVLGDFNDTKDSAALRRIVGRGQTALVDLRPAERNGDERVSPGARLEARQVTWTHFYSKEDSYDRVDYILASSGLVREWDPAGTYVLALPNWGVGSDHRPICARFTAVDR
jgi:endonuclease/exonuclease/phosphatase family metal-dependent hydrolase